MNPIVKSIKWVTMLVCVFAPFLMAGYALSVDRYGLQALHDTASYGWIWIILLASMMVGMYYFLVVFLEDEEKITEEFQRLDRDHDGFISPEDAKSWPDLIRSFDRFDADHDGRLSRVDFEAFEQALPSH